MPLSSSKKYICEPSEQNNNPQVTVKAQLQVKSSKFVI